MPRANCSEGHRVCAGCSPCMHERMCRHMCLASRKPSPLTLAPHQYSCPQVRIYMSFILSAILLSYSRGTRTNNDGPCQSFKQNTHHGSFPRKKETLALPSLVFDRGDEWMICEHTLKNPSQAGQSGSAPNPSYRFGQHDSSIQGAAGVRMNKRATIQVPCNLMSGFSGQAQKRRPWALAHALSPQVGHSTSVQLKQEGPEPRLRKGLPAKSWSKVVCVQSALLQAVWPGLVLAGSGSCQALAAA